MYIFEITYQKVDRDGSTYNGARHIAKIKADTLKEAQELLNKADDLKLWEGWRNKIIDYNFEELLEENNND